MRYASCLIAVAALIGPAASAQEAITKPATAKRRTAAVSRADLANAFLRFEQAFGEKTPQGEQLAQVNKQFDALTLLFFSGNMGQAIQKLNELTASLKGTSDRRSQQVADSLRVRVEPHVHVAGKSPAPVAKVQSLYPVAATGSTTLVLRARGRDGQVAAEKEFVVTTGPETKVDLAIPLGKELGSLPAGRYVIEVGGEGAGGVLADRWFVVPKPLEETRRENEARLAALEEKNPALAQSLVACRARNKLLVDAPNEAKTSELLADPFSLTSDLAAEITSLEAGKDPYAKKLGDYWRTVGVNGIDVPIRVFAPSAAAGDGPIPLLVVFHGAGGDENMFMDAYGAGLVKTLAERRGFLVVSPVSAMFANPAYFDKLIEVLAASYAVDSNRIYVLGHSMGAGVTEAVARARAGKIAAACCIAGGGRGSPKGPIPPTLMLGAELDPLVPATRIEAAAGAAKEAKLPVEFRMVPGQGHTLVVTTQLESAVAWLLAKKLGEDAK